MDPNACHPNATTCVNQMGSYHCICDEGFIGDGLHCEGNTIIIIYFFLISISIDLSCDIEKNGEKSAFWLCAV